MCYGSERFPSKEELTASSRVVEDLRLRLAETEARLARARAREAELSRQLEEMKRFVSVMEILEKFLKTKVQLQQQREHEDEEEEEDL